MAKNKNKGFYESQTTEFTFEGKKYRCFTPDVEAVKAGMVKRSKVAKLASKAKTGK